MKRVGQFWIAHVAAIKREGISANAYAKREGISLPVVYYWQRKLKAAPEVRNAADTAGGIVQLRIADNSIGTPGPRDCTLMLNIRDTSGNDGTADAGMARAPCPRHARSVLMHPGYHVASSGHRPGLPVR